MKWLKYLFSFLHSMFFYSYIFTWKIIIIFLYISHQNLTVFSIIIFCKTVQRFNQYWQLLPYLYFLFILYFNRFIIDFWNYLVNVHRKTFIILVITWVKIQNKNLPARYIFWIFAVTSTISISNFEYGTNGATVFSSLSI